MKKKILYLTIIFMFLFCFGCGRTKLNSPSIQINDGKVTWESIDNASSYEISINGILTIVDSNTNFISLSDGDVIKVRSVGNGKKYETSDWSNVITYNVPTFTVKWMADGLLIEEDVNVKEGTIPSYDGLEPTKSSNDKYSYEFIRWDKELDPVTSDITFNAVFEEKIKSFEVKWMLDNKVLKTELVEYGKTPYYTETVNKESTEKFSYTFIGWDKEVSPVTEDVIYKAQFKEIINHYSINFFDEDAKTLLATVIVEYGETAVYPKNDPTKNATESLLFSFDKWVTEENGIIEDDLTNVIKDRNVYASYKSEIKKVNVYILTNNNFGTLSNDSINNVEYGTEIKIVNNKIYIGNNVIEAKPLESDKQYSYEFIGWETDINISDNTKIIAKFSRTLKQYTITWMLDNTILETDYNVSYGETPIYNGIIPTKPTQNEIDYIFNGWSPAISNVTGNVTYTAIFTEATHKYQIKFYDEDGVTQLGVLALPYGEKANFPNAIPTKPSTAQYDYTFKMWVSKFNGDVEANLEFITGDMNVYAKYDSTIRKYLVSFIDYDGKKIKEELVEYGKSVTAPKDPIRENYKFNGWDNNNYLEVKENIYVYAKYTRLYQVIFYDWNYSPLSIQYIESGANAEEPDIPEVYNHIFDRWSSAFTNIQSDLEVFAEYKKIFLLNYLNDDGSIFESINVIEGDKIVFPLNKPTKTGHHFIRWDLEVDVITENLYITPIFEINKYNVIFKTPEGNVLLYDDNNNLLINSSIVEGGKATEPKVNKYWINWETKQCLEFDGWYYFDGKSEYRFDIDNVKLDNVSNEIGIYEIILFARYINPISEPVLFVDSTYINKGEPTANISVYLLGDFSKIHGLSLSVSYDDDITIRTKDSIYINNKLYNPSEDSNSSNIKIYNNIDFNNSKYEIVWSNGDGVSHENLTNLLEITFHIDKNIIKPNFEINISGTSYIIDESLSKIVPLIINGNIYINK